MYGKKSKLMFVMCMVLGLMSIGYAFFATNLSITSTGNITAGWSVKFVRITDGNNGGTGGSNAANPTYTDTTATISANLKVPGDYMEYEIELQNAGGIDAIIESIDANATGSPAIIFSISGVNQGESLASGEIKKIKVRVEYDSNVTSQPSNTVKVLQISVKAVQDTGQTITNQSPNIDQPLLTQLRYKILSDNVAYADNVSSPYVSSSTGINFSQVSSDTNGKGLYYTSTNTEGNKTTYYFRGAVENNYVKFGKDSSENDIIWRIVRINEDGSIRIVTQDVVGYSAFNYSDSLNSLRYMTNNDNSIIKNYLDTWYVNNLKTNYSKYLADAGFCNDMSIYDEYYNDAGRYTERTYGASGRFSNKPQFACPNASDDLYTITSSSKGNKTLTYSIGLLTLDELAYAGGVDSESNTSMYLTNGSYYWTMSPFTSVDRVDIYHVASWTNDGSSRSTDIGSDGSVVVNGVVIFDGYGGVRPVINLNPTVELSTTLPDGCTKLDGTKNCPYIIKTN